MGLTYKNSGVDIEEGKKFVNSISPIVKSTFSDKVITDIGGFGALFSGSFPDIKNPVLVSGTDGVGTKIKLAQMMNLHNTIGIDAVAMCVNDILVSGAKPLFFLDYISCGKVREDILVEIVKGIAEGCKIAGCSLIGGETAEHPDVMRHEDYDIAGFSVGVVDHEKIITGDKIKKGDLIIGLPSSGVHSNGFSLIRKLFFELKNYKIDSYILELSETIGNVLLKPTRIYCSSILRCIDLGIRIKGIVHITGGGFYDNIPRILPENIAAHISKSSFVIPPIFKLIQKEGKVDEKEMFTTFNMGIGMMIVIDRDDEKMVLDVLVQEGEEPVVLGETKEFKNEKVIIE